MDGSQATAARSCVIGAGGAGLAAVRALVTRGRDFECVEVSDRVGGVANAGTDVTADALGAIEGRLRALGGDVATIPTDIRVQEACIGAIADATARFGRVDVLVGAAGVYPRRPVLEAGLRRQHDREDADAGSRVRVAGDG